MLHGSSLPTILGLLCSLCHINNYQEITCLTYQFKFIFYPWVFWFPLNMLFYMLGLLLLHITAWDSEDILFKYILALHFTYQSMRFWRHFIQIHLRTATQYFYFYIFYLLNYVVACVTFTSCIPIPHAN